MVGQAPLPVIVVVEAIMHHELFGSGRDFIVAGSYPASVQMYERYNVVLQYNDIDVYILSHDPNGFYIQDVELFTCTIDGADTVINVIVLGWDNLDMERLIGNFDINAIMMGFHVTHKSGITVDWYSGNGYFEAFMQHRTLCLINFSNLPSPVSSYVRLLRKACQFEKQGILYRAPEPDELKTVMHKKYMSEKTRCKLDELSGRFLHDFMDNFCYIPIPKPEEAIDYWVDIYDRDHICYQVYSLQLIYIYCEF